MIATKYEYAIPQIIMKAVKLKAIWYTEYFFGELFLAQFILAHSKLHCTRKINCCMKKYYT